MAIYRTKLTGSYVECHFAVVGRLYDGVMADVGDWLVDGVLVRADDFPKYYEEVREK